MEERVHIATRLRFVVPLAVAMALLLCLTFASQSQAYCGVVVAPHSWCSHPQQLTGVKFNAAIYPGSGTVRVCQRVNIWGGPQISYRCGNTVADSGSDLDPYNPSRGTWGMELSVANSSDSPHTIYGNILWF